MRISLRRHFYVFTLQFRRLMRAFKLRTFLERVIVDLQIYFRGVRVKRFFTRIRRAAN